MVRIFSNTTQFDATVPVLVAGVVVGMIGCGYLAFQYIPKYIYKYTSKYLLK